MFIGRRALRWSIALLRVDKLTVEWTPILLAGKNAMACHGMARHGMPCHAMAWHAKACLGMPYCIKFVLNLYKIC